MVKIFVKCIKAKQVHLNRFHCSQIVFAKLRADFRLLKGVDRVLGLRDPRWGRATHLGCATHAESVQHCGFAGARPTWAARPTQSLRDPRRHRVLEFNLSAQIALETTPAAFKTGFHQLLGFLNTFCDIMDGSNMQMKDLKPHSYKIIVFRVWNENEWCKECVCYLKQWYGQPSI